MNEAIRRGEDAKRLLAEPLLVEAFDKLEQSIIQRLRVIDVGALEAQRDWVITLQLLGAVKRHLEQVIATGKLEQFEQDRLSYEKRLQPRGRKAAISGPR